MPRGRGPLEIAGAPAEEAVDLGGGTGNLVEISERFQIRGGAEGCRCNAGLGKRAPGASLGWCASRDEGRSVYVPVRSVEAHIVS